MYVSDIRIDGGTQPRVAIDEAIVAEYVEALRAGATFPPVVVFCDGAEQWLGDGFHRVHAHRQAGIESIAVEVRDGTRRDAVLYSVGANAQHGLRRTNADKRRAVETVLADDEWRTWSDRRIAEACGVSDMFVAKVRRDQVQTDCTGEPAKRVGKDGKAQAARKSKPDEFDSNDPQPAKAKPAAKAAPSEPDPIAYSDGEVIEALSAEIKALKVENDTLRRAADPETVAQINRLKAEIRRLEGERDRLMDESVELKKQIKMMQRREARAANAA